MWMNRTIGPALRETVASRPAVLVTGCRQTGKSSVLQHIFPHYDYISLDLPLAAAEAQESGSDFLDRHPPPLIIDEIQYAPELMRWLKTRIDPRRSEMGRYLLTGSQKFTLMAGASESLAGRISVITLHSLALEELEEHTRKHAESTRLLDWMIMGGYPEVHTQKLDPRRFYSDYTATYLERDVRQLINVRDLRDFEKLLRILAVRSGQLMSLTSLSSDLGLSPNTVKSWMGVLEASNIIHILHPWSRNISSRIVKTPKVYFLDTGLMCFLAGIFTPKELRQSTLLGPFFETLVLGQWLRGRNHRALDDRIYFFRDHQGHEVDFVVPEGEKVHLLECKWSELPKYPGSGFGEMEKQLGVDRIASRTVVNPVRERRRLPKSGFDLNSPVDVWKIGSGVK
jgi:predicted AAA+ superfamily ATPase